MKGIAEVLGRGLKVPVVSITPQEAEGHFGLPASPVGCTLDTDVLNPDGSCHFASEMPTQERRKLGFQPC
jgi:hypothetical protein